MAELNAQGLLRYRIRASDTGQLTAALAGPVADLDDTTVTVHASGVEVGPLTEDQAADLLTAVVASGVRVVAFEPLGSNLESAYLAMTADRE
jgi:ABC-2 type transport system ATP-binding protein